MRTLELRAALAPAKIERDRLRRSVGIKRPSNVAVKAYVTLAGVEAHRHDGRPAPGSVLARVESGPAQRVSDEIVVILATPTGVAAGAGAFSAARQGRCDFMRDQIVGLVARRSARALRPLGAHCARDATAVRATASVG